MLAGHIPNSVCSFLVNNNWKRTCCRDPREFWGATHDTPNAHFSLSVCSDIFEVCRNHFLAVSKYRESLKSSNQRLGFYPSFSPHPFVKPNPGSPIFQASVLPLYPCQSSPALKKKKKYIRQNMGCRACHFLMPTLVLHFLTSLCCVKEEQWNEIMLLRQTL